VLGVPLDQLRDQLDPRACRLANLPDRIWLFGGQGAFTANSAALNLPIESMRDSFWRKAFTSIPGPDKIWIENLDMPEKHEGWWAFSGYDDLLTFERDACYLARAVILFPESPGSFSELGALSVDETIVKRLIVVVQSKYLQDETRASFLNLGPLTRAKTLGLRCVIGGASFPDLTIDDFDTILEFIDQKLPRVPGTEKLQIENPTHKLLLVADLIDLLLVCKPAELLLALNHFGLLMASEDLERAAKLLQFFKLIRIEHRGDEHYFMRQQHTSRTWVDYTASQGKGPFNRSRFKIDREVLLDKRHLSILGRAP
jgi:hypothetical protein